MTPSRGPQLPSHVISQGMGAPVPSPGPGALSSSWQRAGLSGADEPLLLVAEAGAEGQLLADLPGVLQEEAQVLLRSSRPEFRFARVTR